MQVCGPAPPPPPLPFGQPALRVWARRRDAPGGRRWVFGKRCANEGRGGRPAGTGPGAQGGQQPFMQRHIERVKGRHQRRLRAALLPLHRHEVRPQQLPRGDREQQVRPRRGHDAGPRGLGCSALPRPRGLGCSALPRARGPGGGGPGHGQGLRAAAAIDLHPQVRQMAQNDMRCGRRRRGCLVEKAP